MIIGLGDEAGLDPQWVDRILTYAISEFSKKGLGSDYYGYHNITHELEAAFFVLLSAIGQRAPYKFSQKEICYLFTAALFHDYDPLKQFDKPNEDSIELFIRSDYNIRDFVREAGLNLDIMIAIIYRTAYPFIGDTAINAKKHMQELFTIAGIPQDDGPPRDRYEELGLFLSVAERIAGYALGDFDHCKDLARRNAHALGWHPSVINERSVQYFTALKDERGMFDRVIGGAPLEYARTFLQNVAAFEEAWDKELELKNFFKKPMKMISLSEKAGIELDPKVKELVLEIYKELALPMRCNEQTFRKSLSSPDTILITLRVDDINGQVVGYAKGGPLENYCDELRRGTLDRNLGNRNTAYLEGMSVRQGYWGETGGHLIRFKFFQQCTQRGYGYVTGYAHRDVIAQRVRKGERIEIVQRYDPDRLDYYRADLSAPVYQIITESDDSAIYIRA